MVIELACVPLLVVGTVDADTIDDFEGLGDEVRSTTVINLKDNVSF